MCTNLNKITETIGNFASKIDIIDHEFVSKFWNIPVSGDIQIRYSEETLQSVILSNRKGNNNWVLAYHAGLSLEEMREKIRVKKDNRPFLDDSPFSGCEEYYFGKSSRTFVEPGYRLLNFAGKFAGSWDSQEIKLFGIEEM